MWVHLELLLFYETDDVDTDHLAPQQQFQRVEAWCWTGSACHFRTVQLFPEFRRFPERGWVSRLHEPSEALLLTYCSCRPFFVKGCAIGCGFTGLIVVLSLGMYFRLRHINRTKDEKYGPVSDDQQLDVTTLGDSHPAFRYLL